MSRLNRATWASWGIGLAVIIAGGALMADSQLPHRLGTSASGATVEPLTTTLPPVTRAPMKITRGSEKTLVVLSFDDGTCESGLGAGTVVTDLVDFDVPTQCYLASLDIVGLTTRMNTGTATAFAFAQAGATPPPVNRILTAPMTAIPAMGACPATALTTRAIAPGAAVVTGTSNFFAGLRTPSGVAGRDTDGAPAGRIWLLCASCGMTQYSPTDLSAFGLGGNWMIRVTVECPDIPVELMSFVVN